MPITALNGMTFLLHFPKVLAWILVRGLVTLHFSSLLQGMFWDSTLQRAAITPMQSLSNQNPQTPWHLKPHYLQR